MTDLRERVTGDPSYLSRVERMEYILRRRAEKATIQQIADELHIAKQNVGRYLTRGTVRPSGRQPSNAGRKDRLTKRIARWQARRLTKIMHGIDVSFEDMWIADLEGRLRDLK